MMQADECSTRPPKNEGDDSPTNNQCKWNNAILPAFLIIAIIVAIVLGATLSNRNGDHDDSYRSSYPPRDYGYYYQDNVKIESYRVSTTIDTRFATTHVNIVFANEGNCSVIHGFTTQLPNNARVTSLTMRSLDCIFQSDVQEESRAQQTFDKQASQGKPAALLTAWDMANYYMQVSLPPVGKTIVELVYEQVLTRRSYKIPFQIPVSPGQPVDLLLVDILVKEPEAGVSNFGLEDPSGAFQITQSRSEAKASLELHNANETVLPRLLNGWYDSSGISESGLLVQSESCLVYLFKPSNKSSNNDMFDPLPRNIVFVIDISGSMSGQKLEDAKVAFARIIESLTPQDFFAVHTFSDLGTESAGGPAMASNEAKASAIDFVQGLSTLGGTNLNDAFIEGVLKTKDMKEQFPSHVPIVIVLTDGRATVGTTNSPSIARNIRAVNEQVGAKIFGLAFGVDADLNLLKGISIQNDGKAVEIFDGFFDSANQIEDFYRGELGTIRFSDIHVLFEGDSSIDVLTRTSFPVLADGSEVVVHALMSEQTRRALEADSGNMTINATTTASTSAGDWAWSVTSRRKQVDTNFSNECFQSYAHSRIAEIMEFRDATWSLGRQMADYAPFDVPDFYVDDLASLAYNEALKVALEADIVWPGLTALVTLESESCAKVLDSINVCHAGDGADGDWYDGDSSFADPVSESAPPAWETGASCSIRVFASLVVSYWSFFMIFQWIL